MRQFLLYVFLIGGGLLLEQAERRVQVAGFALLNRRGNGCLRAILRAGRRSGGALHQCRKGLYALGALGGLRGSLFRRRRGGCGGRSGLGRGTGPCRSLGRFQKRCRLLRQLQILLPRRRSRFLNSRRPRHKAVCLRRFLLPSGREHPKSAARADYRAFLRLQFCTGNGIAPDVDIIRDPAASCARCRVCLLVQRGRRLFPLPLRGLCKAGILCLPARRACSGPRLGMTVCRMLCPLCLSRKEIPEVGRGHAGNVHQPHAAQNQHQNIRAGAAAQEQQRPAERRAEHTALEAPPRGRAGRVQRLYALEKALSRQLAPGKDQQYPADQQHQQQRLGGRRAIWPAVRQTKAEIQQRHGKNICADAKYAKQQICAHPVPYGGARHKNQRQKQHADAKQSDAPRDISLFSAMLCLCPAFACAAAARTARGGALRFFGSIR